MRPKSKATGATSARIGVAFLILGILALTYSIIEELQIFAFIGLGLTFWGALFAIITPKRFVEGQLLDTAALPNYQTADRIIRTFKQQPSAYYTPPYPTTAPLPEHLKGLKEMVVFITNETEKVVPDIQELTEGKFIMHTPSGVAISPPGIGLLASIENKTNSDFAKMNLEELCETLPRLVLENFGLADNMEMAIQDQNTIKLELVDSVYKNLYISENNLKSIAILGCPIVSATACAIAKTTGKPVAIQQQETSPLGLRLQAILKIKQE